MDGWRDFTELKSGLRALADKVRLNIVYQLAGRDETTVTDLVFALSISQPLVSWHLRMLRKAGLVRTRRHGREVYCSLDRARFAFYQRALSDLLEPPRTADTAMAEAPPLQPTAVADPPTHLARGPRPASRPRSRSRAASP